MSALDFLSPYKAEASERFKPLLRSSMERRLRDDGAEFEERGGWLVASKLPHEHALGVRDVSHLGKFEVRGDLSGVENVVRITPERGLVLCDYADARRVHAELAERVHVVDMTGALAVLEIEGRGADTLMRRITAHDLDDLPAAAPVSHVGPCVITREADDRYRIVFPQEYGHYLWEVVADAAEPLGGGPTP